jgi:competence ComEA-like helix-hairpin-helix protein
LKQRNTRERWSEIVDDMVARGAEASDADLEKIVIYLARNQGPRGAINKASEADIAAALEIPRATAAAIVAWRQKNGPFKTLADLQKVPGVNAANLDGKQDRIAFD